MPLTTRKSRQIQDLVLDLLERANVKKPAVPVDRIARMCQAEIRYVEFAGDISGLLSREGGHILIGVNVSHSTTRQRFTIAHELGHLCLSHLDKYGKNEIRVDRDFKVMLRDGKSSQATDIAEIEANAFAAELLMPTVMLKSDPGLKRGLDCEDDELIRGLAKRYKVSSQAMTFRLANLSEILAVQNRNPRLKPEF